MSEILRVMGKRLEALYKKKALVESEKLRLTAYKAQYENLSIGVMYSYDDKDRKKYERYEKETELAANSLSRVSIILCEIDSEVKTQIKEMLKIEKKLGTDLDVAKQYKDILHGMANDE